MTRSACAADLPAHSITLVVPFRATGTADIYGTPIISKVVRMMQRLSRPPVTDVLAEQLASVLSAALNQPVNLSRRPALNGISALHDVMRATPDGQTLMLAGNPVITAFPQLLSKLGTVPVTDSASIAPVAQIARMPLVMIATHASSVRSVTQLIAYARRESVRIDYAALGDGSTSRYAGALLGSTTGMRLTHVNYNGGDDALNGVVTRQVEFGILPLPALLPYLNGNGFALIAITSAQRHSLIPNVPTIAESGVAGFDAVGWFGVFVPVRTPDAVIKQLNDELTKAFSSDALTASLTQAGLSAGHGNVEEFRTEIASDTARWTKLLQAQ